MVQPGSETEASHPELVLRTRKRCSMAFPRSSFKWQIDRAHQESIPEAVLAQTTPATRRAAKSIPSRAGEPMRRLRSAPEVPAVRAEASTPVRAAATTLEVPVGHAAIANTLSKR